jgi:hypothetical protein
MLTAVSSALQRSTLRRSGFPLFPLSGDPLRLLTSTIKPSAIEELDQLHPIEFRVSFWKFSVTLQQFNANSIENISIQVFGFRLQF